MVICSLFNFPSSPIFTFEADFIPFERHVRIIKVRAALDDQIDPDWHLLGHIPSAGQVDGERLEGDRHIALDWNA